MEINHWRFEVEEKYKHNSLILLQNHGEKKLNKARKKDIYFVQSSSILGYFSFEIYPFFYPLANIFRLDFS